MVKSKFRYNPHLQWHLKEIGRWALLAPEEEIKLGREIQRGSLKAQEELAQANLRLVVKIAKGYTNPEFLLSDAIQEGYIGLLKAVVYFDPEQKTKFSNYAPQWIKKTIIEALIDRSRNIRWPANQCVAFKRLDKARWRLTQDLGHKPTIKDIATKLDEEIKIIEKIETSPRTISFETVVYKNKNGGKPLLLKDFVLDKKNITPGEKNDLIFLNKFLKKILFSLKEKEQKVLRMHFGLDGFVFTPDEIGKMLKLTKERVRQIKETALKKFRSKIKKGFGIEDFKILLNLNPFNSSPFC